MNGKWNLKPSDYIITFCLLMIFIAGLLELIKGMINLLK